MSRLALVLSGGGARGAYEAGVIHYIRTALPRRISERVFDIQCGSSAGAINTAILSSFAHSPLEQGEQIKNLWLSLTPEDVYKRNLSAAARFLSYTMGGILRNLTSFNPFDLGKKSGAHFNALLDTTPLLHQLRKKIDWKQIELNVKKGPISAVSITATNTRSGRSELFISKKSHIQYTGDYRFHETALTAEHVMASSAIPLIFPTVKVDKIYYTDGGVHLFTPMAPAIQLGADKIIIIGLRHPATPQEIEDYDSKEMKEPPSIAQLSGRLMNMIFLDRVVYDLDQLHRINRLIEWSEAIYGENYLERVNQLLVKQSIRGDIANRGLKNIPVVEILPSQFISKIYELWFNKLKKGVYKLSALEKLLLRLLDVDANGAMELLSYLTFSKPYLSDLIDLGYEDARVQRDRLIEIMDEDSQ